MRLLSILFLMIMNFNLFGKEVEIEQNNFTNPVITYIDHGQSLVYLSNETVWEIKEWEPLSYTKQRNSHQLQGWQVGERIYTYVAFIAHTDLVSSWFFHNLDTKYTKSNYNKFLVRPISLNLPRISRITVDGSFIELTDGSQWHVGWWSSLWTQYWEIGDKVLANVERESFTFGNNTHVLKNLSRSSELVNTTLINIQK